MGGHNDVPVILPPTTQPPTIPPTQPPTIPPTTPPTQETNLSKDLFVKLTFKDGTTKNVRGYGRFYPGNFPVNFEVMNCKIHIIPFCDTKQDGIGTITIEGPYNWNSRGLDSKKLQEKNWYYFVTIKTERDSFENTPFDKTNDTSDKTNFYLFIFVVILLIICINSERIKKLF